MAYDSDNAVENESYCMPSMQKRNVDSMSEAMGYHNMADRANTKAFPVGMSANKSNPQEGPTASNGKYNYDANR